MLENLRNLSAVEVAHFRQVILTGGVPHWALKLAEISFDALNAEDQQRLVKTISDGTDASSAFYMLRVRFSRLTEAQQDALIEVIATYNDDPPVGFAGVLATQKAAHLTKAQLTRLIELMTQGLSAYDSMVLLTQYPSSVTAEHRALLMEHVIKHGDAVSLEHLIARKAYRDDQERERLISAYIKRDWWSRQPEEVYAALTEAEKRGLARAIVEQKQVHNAYWLLARAHWFALSAEDRHGLAQLVLTDGKPHQIVETLRDAAYALSWSDWWQLSRK